MLDTRLGVERVEPHPFVGEVPSHGVGVEGGELVADGEGQSVVDAGGDAHAQLEGMDAPLVAVDVVIVGRDARYPVVACDVYPFVGDVQQQSGFSGEMEVREVCPQEGWGHEEDRRTEVEVGGGLWVVGDCPPFAAWGTFHVQRSPETDGTADTDTGQRHPVITHFDLPEVCCQDVACQVDAVVWCVIFVPGGGTDGEEGEPQRCEGEEGARMALRESLKHTTFHILFWA